MPRQKPHRSKQNYGTPENFLDAAKRRLGIKAFAFDFAASAQNAKAAHFWSKRENSLRRSPGEWAAQLDRVNDWGWLNPEFSLIQPWAEHCADLRALNRSIALLVPASVGSDWFRDHVDGIALVLMLNGRLAFIRNRPKWLYPKDCILALYSPEIEPGYEVWNWRVTLTGGPAR